MDLDFHKIEKKLGLKFNNIDLLKRALTHRSFLNENKEWFKIGQNERLEFLGDAVFGLIAAEYLFRKYPKLKEGELTSLRAALINSNSLLEVADKLEIKKYLLVSKGEKKELKKAHPYFLANAVESIVGAIYLDQGLEETSEFIEKHILVKADQILKTGSHRDSKSVFQEKSQELLGITPIYKFLESWGPDHSRQFKTGVYLKEKLIAEGEGFSKHEAETKAAEKALLKKGWK
ncbi:MAG: ribonuclease III [Candidatus Pacebacteria bacterium]|jgi:ribonuclease-3|nr:ribonuclease III [Candidatus Paceibacterota bacterium]MDD4994393.1 ribonuclease III [Candidatus Paceibacterota bacterium]MDD5535098.1 ribonuclease III [Candidatus Paceibacterota bacterium]